jgi:hypothetical protein
MSENQKHNPYEALKEIGVKFEQQMNELIHNHLNDEEIIERASMHIQSFAQFLEPVKEFVEVISIPLNLPTKTDIANVAKQSIKIEEKLEEIEEKIINLTDFIEQMKQVPPSTNRSTDEEKSPQMPQLQSIPQKETQAKLNKELELLQNLLNGNQFSQLLVTSKNTSKNKRNYA